MNNLAQITDSLYLGSCKAASDERLLRAKGITLVINVTAEIAFSGFKDIAYMRISILDNPGYDVAKHFDVVADRIEEERKIKGKILVHCVAGISRSPTVVLAYLMKHCQMKLIDAHSLVKSRRIFVRPNWGFWKQLVEYERKVFHVNTIVMIPSATVGWIPSIYKNERVNVVW